MSSDSHSYFNRESISGTLEAVSWPGKASRQAPLYRFPFGSPLRSASALRVRSGHPASPC